MKIIGKDMYDRECVADVLVTENLNVHYADTLVDHLNLTQQWTELYYSAVSDDHVLWKGMEELV